MSLNNKNKGSILFIFYFIIGIALLAVAGYYIGLNEQTKLFKSISDKKQQQENPVVDLNKLQGVGILDSVKKQPQETPIKSLIDSPITILKNLRNASNLNDTSGGISTGTNSTNSTSSYNDSVESNAVANANASEIFNIARQSFFLIKTAENKKGDIIELSDGEAYGNSCYTTDAGKLCFPYYKLEKIWAVGDLNGDRIDDAIVSVSALESISPVKIVNDNFYAMMSSSAIPSKDTVSTTSSPIIVSSSTVDYATVLFNYGSSVPKISSIEIADGTASLIGSFYTSSDKAGKPSLSKVVRYRVDSKKNELIKNTSTASTTASMSASSTKSVESPSSTSTETAVKYSIQKIGEARLFKEQWEKTSVWYPYNYAYSDLAFSFKIPEAWPRVENFEKGLELTFKDTDDRSLIIDAKSIIETCSEYGFNLNDDKDVKIKTAYFIDLGSFGVGYYIKYARSLANNVNGYFADICVNDKNNDKKIFSIHSSTKEDSDPYFVIFDKIWSTFKIKQEETTN